jgi:hypothetical protein
VRAWLPPNEAMKLTSALAERALGLAWPRALGQGAPLAPRRSQPIAGVRRTRWRGRQGGNA